MIAKLGTFKFSFDEASMSEIKEEYDLGWKEKERINNNKKITASKEIEKSIAFSGELILKPMDSLAELEKIAKERKPILYTTILQSYLVLIMELSINKDIFLNDGEFIKQGFSIKLARYYK
jgi:phage protein U